MIGGTINSNGWFIMEATHVGDNTTLANLLKLVDDSTNAKAPVERMADRISSFFVPAVIIVAIITLIVWLAVGEDLTKAISSAISVLIISCPCAMGLATPTAIMVAVEKSALHGILIKSTASIEVANKLDTVVLGKTGTLTLGRPSVSDLIPAEGILREELLGLAASLEQNSEHPLATAICDYAAQSDCPSFPVSEFLQMPGAGVSGIIAGKECLAGNKRMMKAKGIDVSGYVRITRELSDRGKTPLFFAADGEIVGILGIADPVSPNSARAVAELRAMGMKTVMLTSDSRRTAEALQRQVGTNRVIAEVMPEDKEAKIRDLGRGETLAMVGNGVQDAAALTRADLGFAVGVGTDLDMPSADVLLMSGDPMEVPATIKLCRATMRKIKQNLYLALFYNLIGIPVAAIALVGIGATLGPMIAAAAMSISSLYVVSSALKLRSWKPSYVTPEDTQPLIPAKISQAMDNDTLASFDTTEFDRIADTGSFKIAVSTARPIETRHLDIDGMNSEGCAKRVTEALESIDGVVSVNVDLNKQRADVELSRDLSGRLLAKAIKSVGYQATPYNMDKDAIKHEQRQKNRQHRREERELQKELSQNTAEIRIHNRELMEELEQGAHDLEHVEDRKRKAREQHRRRKEEENRRNQAHDSKHGQEHSTQTNEQKQEHQTQVDEHSQKHGDGHEDSLERLDEKLQAREQQRQVRREHLERRRQQREQTHTESDQTDVEYDDNSSDSDESVDTTPDRI